VPDWKKEITERFADLKLQPTREAEIVEEFAQHLEDRYEELLSDGVPAEEAQCTALTELSGSNLMMKEIARLKRFANREPANVRGFGKLPEGLWQDLRYGVRIVAKNPGFTLIAVLTLALGIGANAALFSVVNGVLLNPLPYPQPDQLVTLHQTKPNFEVSAISYPNFRDWQKENRTFSAMAVSRGTGFTMIGEGEAERVSARWITADYFSVLGIKSALGRTFITGEDEIGAAPVVLISEDLWQRKFRSSPDVLEQSITLDDKSYSIVGVIPASFTLTNVDVYAPIGQWSTPMLNNRGVALGLIGIGRLKPGVTVAQAQSDLDRVTRNLADAHPETNTGTGGKIVGLRETLVGDIRPNLLLLLGAVGLVLLIACVNVSNLQLARATGRRREFAIRAAMGAGRWRLLRQSLTESTLLAGAGGALGLLVAGWGTPGGVECVAHCATTLQRSQA
jgi:predicted permease